jgi:hypothetical protein
MNQQPISALAHDYQIILCGSVGIDITQLAEQLRMRLGGCWRVVNPLFEAPGHKTRGKNCDPVHVAIEKLSGKQHVIVIVPDKTMFLPGALVKVLFEYSNGDIKHSSSQAQCDLVINTKNFRKEEIEDNIVALFYKKATAGTVVKKCETSPLPPPDHPCVV